MQSAGLIPERGARFTLRVRAGDTRALSRQVVKGDHARVTVPELDFEIPPNTQKGVMTTARAKPLLRVSAAPCATRGGAHGADAWFRPASLRRRHGPARQQPAAELSASQHAASAKQRVPGRSPG